MTTTDPIDGSGLVRAQAHHALSYLEQEAKKHNVTRLVGPVSKDEDYGIPQGAVLVQCPSLNGKDSNMYVRASANNIPAPFHTRAMSLEKQVSFVNRNLKYAGNAAARHTTAQTKNGSDSLGVVSSGLVSLLAGGNISPGDVVVVSIPDLDSNGYPKNKNLGKPGGQVPFCVKAQNLEDITKSFIAAKNAYLSDPNAFDNISAIEHDCADAVSVLAVSSMINIATIITQTIRVLLSEGIMVPAPIQDRPVGQVAAGPVELYDRDPTVMENEANAWLEREYLKNPDNNEVNDQRRENQERAVITIMKRFGLIRNSNVSDLLTEDSSKARVNTWKNLWKEVVRAGLPDPEDLTNFFGYRQTEPTRSLTSDTRETTTATPEGEVLYHYLNAEPTCLLSYLNVHRLSNNAVVGKAISKAKEGQKVVVNTTALANT